MKEKKQMAYLPLKSYVKGKEALTRIEIMKECMLRGDYVETPSKIADILGCSSGKEELLSYLPVEEYANGLIAISRISALENMCINSQYSVPTEIISGILGFRIPKKDKPNE